MFTIKATYRNETRRFTFSESVLFPTYKELHDQLYRIFPISHNYHLSRLIFSPDASKPGRILVGKEVHSAEDYESCVAPLRRLWPNPLLRFTIFDETPHKTPSVATERLSLYSAPAIPSSEATSKLQSPVVTRRSCILPPSSRSFVPLPTPPSKMSPLPPPPPPPPIIFSPMPSGFCPSPECGTAKTAPCCPIAKGRRDLEVLLSSFKDDLERILSGTFGTDYAEKRSDPLVGGSTSGVPGADIVPDQGRTSVSTSASLWCFVCRTSFTGVWYGCIKCPWHVVCPSCFSKSHSAHTLSFGPTHVVHQRSTGSAHASAQNGGEAMPPINTPETQQPSGPVSSSVGSELASAVHHGVICDSCEETVVGTRHKCLDCPDYDLCTACVKSGATEQHNPFHEFFDIGIPGRVYVHTVLGGDRDQSLENRQQHHNSNHVAVTQQSRAPVDSLVRHSASCNLCDSAIVGERYKCIVCPDFDACSSCFRITMEQHPSHGFVKVSKPEDLMMRESLPLRQVGHLAVCDYNIESVLDPACRKTIRGARYKCMHPSCPDFDLCSNCEALPIPVHPQNHPLLKLKTSDTVIPTVYRVGQIQAIDEPATRKSVPVCGEPSSPPPSSRSPPVAPMVSPRRAPVAVGCYVANVTAEDQTPFGEEFLSPPGSPRSDALGEAPPSVTIAPSHLLVDIADEPASPGSTHPGLDIHRQLWPRVNQEMMHLNADQALKAGDSVAKPDESTNTNPVTPHQSHVAEESLPGTTAISSISQASEHRETCPRAPRSDPASVADGHRTPSPVPRDAQELDRIAQRIVADYEQEMATSSPPQQTWKLDSALVGDTNVPDGQIFPPGAEFVKGWRMKNNGNRPWPATTEVQFVAGEMFASEFSPALKAEVGVVFPGQDFDIWTGDLKAPDVPGRYVGYWRLNDGQGGFFGSSVWIDLTVVDHHSDQASEHSLAASSMVMPSAHHTNSVNVSDQLQDALRPSLPSSKTVTDEAEDPESDVSSVSLVSVPTSDDEDSEWQDTRTHSEPLEYVVLYDRNSEE